MFFLLGPTYDKLPKAVQFSDTVSLFLDEGWNIAMFDGKTVYYKGYCLDYNINTDIEKILADTNPVEGIFCAIIFDPTTNIVSFKHSFARGFGIFYSQDSITNILLDYDGYLNASQDIVMDNGTIKVTDNGLSHTPYAVDKKGQDYLSVADAVTIIKGLMVDTTTRFVTNNPGPLHCSYSGGIDSLLAWAVLNTVTTNYTTNVADILAGVDNRAVNATTFLNFLKDIEWGYADIDYGLVTTYFVTGFWGDEIMMRNPVLLNMIANVKGTTVLQLATDSPDAYMSNYFLKQKNSTKVSKQEQIDPTTVNATITGRVTHDYQMWHIDNNFHFSPFFDLRILDVILSMSIDDILDNGMNATVQKNLLTAINSDMLTWLDSCKNFDDTSYTNFKANYKQ